jgi:hypothetical protein
VATTNSFSLATTPTSPAACLRNCAGHGVCVDAACVCAPLWTGVACEDPVCPSLYDPATHPCSGNGTCIVTSDVPGCVCRQGYTGVMCSEPDCASVHANCDNVGTCTFSLQTIVISSVSTSLQYPMCECPVSRVGTTCDTCAVGFGGASCNSIDCTPWNDCSGHGSCVPDSSNGGRGMCQCDADFTGDSCDIPFCAGSPPCSGHGDCIVTGSTSRCNCHERWFGDQCNTSTCVGTPECSGRGTCEVRNSQPTCICDELFGNVDCSRPLCAHLNGCSGHGSCVLGTSGTPSCSCQDSFSGADCSDQEDNRATLLVILLILGMVIAFVVLIIFLCWMYKRYARSRQVGTGGNNGESYFDPISKSRPQTAFAVSPVTAATTTTHFGSVPTVPPTPHRHRIAGPVGPSAFVGQLEQQQQQQQPASASAAGLSSPPINSMIAAPRTPAFHRHI